MNIEINHKIWDIVIHTMSKKEMKVVWYNYIFWILKYACITDCIWDVWYMTNYEISTEIKNKCFINFLTNGHTN